MQLISWDEWDESKDLWRKINRASGTRSLFPIHGARTPTVRQMAASTSKKSCVTAWIHVPEITGCPSLETLPRVIASTSLTEWLIVDERRYTILGSDTACTSNSAKGLMRFANTFCPNNGMPAADGNEYLPHDSATKILLYIRFHKMENYRIFELSRSIQTAD